MLHIFCKFKDINFTKLMALYAEGNEINAAAFYEKEEKNVAVLKAEASFYQYLKEDFFAADGALYAVWEECGTYISALRLEPYRDGLLLEALETHPEYRRMGFAEKLLHAVQEHLKQHGKTVVYSHIGKNNTASLKTHLACGFERVLEHAVYIDGSVTSRACTMRYIVGR